MSLSEDDDSPFATARRALTADQFREALARLRTRSGLSYRQIARLAGLELPSSTAHSMCTTASLPRQEAQLRAFVRACGESEEAEDAWVEECERVRRKLRVEAPTVRTRIPTSA